MEIETINEKLKEILRLPPLEKEEEIDKLSMESGKKKTRLLEQLKVLEGDENKRIKQVRNEAGRELTQKQFEVLEKNIDPDNQLLAEAIDQGIDFINSNDMVLAHCKTFLRSIMSGNSKKTNIKYKFLDMISGRDKRWAEATELLVDYVKNQKKFYTTKEDKNSEVWVYREGVYEPEGKSEVKQILRDVLDEHYSQFIFGKVLEKIEVDTFIEPKDFFKNDNINEIPLQNGILDIMNIELKPFDPDKIFFNKLPVKFDHEKDCPQVENFLKDVLANEEDINVFYEIAGVSLLKDYRFEKAFMFVGDGRNGKSKSIELLKRLVGVKNTCSVPLSSLLAQSFFISELFGKMLNLAGDIGNQDLKDTGMFKTLTGRDEVNAHRKFKNDINFVNYAKFVFGCNDLPMVYDISKGFWSRWILLDFPYTFVSKEEYDNSEDKTMLKIRDETIIDKITKEDEMSGFLNNALMGLHRLMKNKDFSSTKGSDEVKRTWIRRSNSFMAFCLDNIEEDVNGSIRKRDLRKIYSEYCKKHKINSKSDIVIKRVLQDNYGVVDEQRRVSGLDYSEWFWVGIKWKQKK